MIKKKIKQNFLYPNHRTIHNPFSKILPLNHTDKEKEKRKIPSEKGKKKIFDMKMKNLTPLSPASSIPIRRSEKSFIWSNDELWSVERKTDNNRRTYRKFIDCFAIYFSVILFLIISSKSYLFLNHDKFSYIRMILYLIEIWFFCFRKIRHTKWSKKSVLIAVVKKR